MSLWSLAAIGVVALISGSFALGYSQQGAPFEEVTSAEVTDAIEAPSTRPAAALAAVPTQVRTCSIESLATSQALGTFAGVVVDPLTGETLWTRSPDVGVTPASVAKIMTATAAISTLGADTRFGTEVRLGETPSSIVLVAGGDPTLSALPFGATGVYRGAPTLQALAEATVAALQLRLDEGESPAITELGVDLSLWDPEDSWDESWAPTARTNGFMSLVTPLQIDGDRQNPAVEYSPRSVDPVTRAAEAFVSALRSAGNTSRSVTIVFHSAEHNAPLLAAVESRPVSELVGYMLKESDNTLAEMLARHVSVALGFGGSSASVQQAIGTALAALGLEPHGATIRDGSGLSPLNRVSAEYVGDVLVELYRNSGELRAVVEGLPISGVDGSLGSRFAGENSQVREKVVAKTGSISGARSLAGFVEAEDTSALAFALFSLGEVGDDTRSALETLVVGLYSCGSNLADF